MSIPPITRPQVRSPLLASFFSFAFLLPKPIVLFLTRLSDPGNLILRFFLRIHVSPDDGYPRTGLSHLFPPL